MNTFIVLVYFSIIYKLLFYSIPNYYNVSGESLFEYYLCILLNMRKDIAQILLFIEFPNVIMLRLNKEMNQNLVPFLIHELIFMFVKFAKRCVVT